MKKYLLTLLVALFLFGCQSATDTASTPEVTATEAQAEITPTIEVASTITSTPQPPLKSHEWTPQPVLARLDLTRTESGVLNPPPPPQFILYADGKALLTRPAIEGYPQGDQQLIFKQLEPKEVCRILNTLDQTGFLDYNPASYEFIGGKPNMTGAVSAYIEVNAWKSHKNEYLELPFYIFDELTGLVASGLAKDGSDINDRNGFPIIAPALRNAYYLLTDYPLDGFEVYEPDKLAVWIHPLNPDDFPNAQWEDWSFSALTISYMYSKINNDSANSDEHYMILRKQGAANLYEYLKQAFSTKYYVETSKLGEKKYYAIYARPLLPYELPGSYNAETPTPAPTPVTPKLKCTPADGMLPIPEPNLIYNLSLP